jgi:hypothetical protein
VAQKQHTEGRRQPALRWARRAALVALPLAVAGEAGHQIFTHLRDQLAHHFFHIVFGIGAFIIFSIYVGIDIYRHGWPGLSWRARPAPREPRPGHRSS